MLNTFRRLTSYLDQKDHKSLYFLTFLYLLYPVIDVYSISIIIPVLNNITSHPISSSIILQVFLLGFIFLLKGFFNLTIHKVSCNFLQNTAHSWSVRVYELYNKEDLLAHNQKSAMQALAGILGDTETCASIIVTTINLFIHSLTLLGYFLVTIYLSKWIGLISCSLIIVLTIMLLIHNRKRIEEYGNKKRKISIKVNSQISTSYGSYKEMKIDARMKNMLKKFEQSSREYAQVRKNFDFTNQIISILLQNVLLASLFFLLAALLLSGIVLTDFLTALAACILLLIRMLSEANTIAVSINGLYFGKKNYEIFETNMNRYQVMKEDEKALNSLRKKNVTLYNHLQVENLTFSYSGGNTIFEDASIEILPGSSTAIIGSSGAGKTTFLDLLLGLLKPQSGHIWYDDYDLVAGKDSSGKCHADLGNIVSYIPQTVYLNGETIRNNVAFMLDEGNIDESKIIECLKCCQIWADIQKMPDGIDTLIGENGTAISGGQRQRIALARALYKDFKILIMDEATAALDIETESAVMDSIRQLEGNKTLLMVTHHQSLANACEHIYRIENKKFVKIK